MRRIIPAVLPAITHALTHALPAVALAVLAASAGAQTPGNGNSRTSLTDTDRPQVTLVESVRLNAVVTAIDKPTRTVTLRHADGDEESVAVGPEARNFDQIAVGDRVHAEFDRLTNIFARPPLAGASMSEGSSITRAAPGEKPGGTTVTTTEAIAVIEGIDPARRSVTMRGPQGRTRTIQVAPDVPGLENVRIGDEVVIRHTEAIAIAVMKQ